VILTGYDNKAKGGYKMANVVPPRKIPITVRLLALCPDCKSTFSFKKVAETKEEPLSTTSKYKCSKCGHSDSWTGYPRYVKF
jgi:hypothetical protein